MKIHVTINSYERPVMLANLVNQIREMMPSASIRVYDDGTKKERFPNVDAEVVHTAHFGKRGYWRIWQRIVKELPDGQDLYLFFPDDVVLNPGFADHLEDFARRAKDDVLAINLLNDRGRMGLSNWRSGIPTIFTKKLMVSGWWDLCGVLSRSAIKALREEEIKVDRLRWRRNPNLGSGVGQVITEILRKKGAFILQTRLDLIEHIGHVSKMNPENRQKSPMDTWTLEPIIVGMATIPGREKQAQRAIDSLAPYVDQVNVVYNGPGNHKFIGPGVHTFYADNRRGDAEKFSALDHLKGDFYFLSVDDDIIYPAGYTWQLIRKIEQYNRSAVVGVHGKTLPRKVARFYGGHRVMYHTTQALAKDQVVNCLGTGTMGFHSSTINFNAEKCETANMADIWMAIECQRQNIPQIAVSRPANWLKIQPLPPGSTIYEQHHKRGEIQTEIWNGAGEKYGWDLKTEYLKRT